MKKCVRTSRERKKERRENKLVISHRTLFSSRMNIVYKSDFHNMFSWYQEEMMMEQEKK